MPECGRFVRGHSGGLGVGAQKAQRLKGTSTGGDAEQTSQTPRAERRATGIFVVTMLV
jgi:hypothetical protein